MHLNQPFRNWMGLSLKDFVELLKLDPTPPPPTPQEFQIIYSTPLQMLDFYNLPLKNSISPQPWGINN